MNIENTICRTILHQAVASVRFHQESIADELRKYDKLVDTGMTPETAFKIVHQASGADNTPAAVQSLKQLIKSELEALNKSHPGIGVGHAAQLERVKRAALKWNNRMAEISKNVQVKIGQYIVKINESEYENQRYDMPNICRESFTAIASDRSGKQHGKLECEVRLFGNR